MLSSSAHGGTPIAFSCVGDPPAHEGGPFFIQVDAEGPSGFIVYGDIDGPERQIEPLVFDDTMLLLDVETRALLFVYHMGEHRGSIPYHPGTLVHADCIGGWAR